LIQLQIAPVSNQSLTVALVRVLMTVLPREMEILQTTMSK